VLTELDEPKSSSVRGWLIAGVALIVLVLFLTMGGEEKAPEEPQIEEVYLPGFFQDITKETRVSVQVFFPGSELALKGEEREIYGTKELVDRLRQVMIIMLQGPRSKDLNAAFPEGVRLRELYLHEGCAYIDLEIREPDRGIGAMMEQLALVSIRETVRVNFPTLERVKIVIDGEERETLFGHVDIRAPIPLGGEQQSAF
jgi:hypothetical protein